MIFSQSLEVSMIKSILLLRIFEALIGFFVSKIDENKTKKEHDFIYEKNLQM